METARTELITEVFVEASIEEVWRLWTKPEHIAEWNNPTEEWHTPHAENDLRIGGKLFLRMELKSGKDGFDYISTYDEVVVNEKIKHTTADNRKTTVLFFISDSGIRIREIFEPDIETPIDTQQMFCQSILNNFKRYVENENSRGIKLEVE